MVDTSAMGENLDKVVALGRVEGYLRHENGKIVHVDGYSRKGGALHRLMSAFKKSQYRDLSPKSPPETTPVFTVHRTDHTGRGVPQGDPHGSFADAEAAAQNLMSKDTTGVLNPRPSWYVAAKQPDQTFKISSVTATNLYARRRNLEEDAGGTGLHPAQRVMRDRAEVNPQTGEPNVGWQIVDNASGLLISPRFATLEDAKIQRSLRDDPQGKSLVHSETGTSESPAQKRLREKAAANEESTI